MKRVCTATKFLSRREDTAVDASTFVDHSRGAVCLGDLYNPIAKRPLSVVIPILELAPSVLASIVLTKGCHRAGADTLR